jgi:signal peptidase II
LFADQVSKGLVVAQLEEGQSWGIAPWLAPIVRVTHVTNTGAAFGLFPKLGGAYVVVAAVVIVIILLYSRNLPADRSLVRVSLGLQLGGAAGNLLDRLCRGFVVDFLDVNFWPLKHWPVFNVADASVVVGVALLALMMILEDRRERVVERTIGYG